MQLVPRGPLSVPVGCGSLMLTHALRLSWREGGVGFFSQKRRFCVSKPYVLRSNKTWFVMGDSKNVNVQKVLITLLTLKDLVVVE